MEKIQLGENNLIKKCFGVETGYRFQIRSEYGHARAKIQIEGTLTDAYFEYTIYQHEHNELSIYVTLQFFV